MADNTIIADWPPPDGREWDCQCARCGSSTGREDCWECRAEGCFECSWRGGWEVCLSDAAWCDAHPRPDRAGVQRGAIEWFVVQRGGDRG